jgi:hypothetical protein
MFSQKVAEFVAISMALDHIVGNKQTNSVTHDYMIFFESSLRKTPR